MYPLVPLMPRVPRSSLERRAHRARQDRQVCLPPPLDADHRSLTINDFGRGYKSRGLHEPDEAIKTINERVQELAKKKGCTMAQVALAWSLANEFISAPIIGTTSLANLKELLGEWRYLISFGLVFRACTRL